jgi:fused signal recognition particle receptor
MAIQTLFGSVPTEPDLLDRLKAGIQKTRSGLVDRLEDVLSGKKEIDADLLEELEYTLITADLGVRTVEDILQRIRQRVDRKMTSDAAEIRTLVREQLSDALRDSETPIRVVTDPPAVVMIVGVNGSGKTTSIGKLANRFLGEGRKVLLCAADTFRAGAIEQLEIWAQRAGVEMIRQKTGADPSAVLFDALQAAKARRVDYVIVDSAWLTTRGLAGARRHDRAKRFGAGPEIHRIGRRHRDRVDET